ncbi:hypothetical protein [Celeribacter sp.]|uniref:capsular polysaccharide export protein, LipB/KpsS family n=1 Tax=Celeribacter sp. TaxID=1890673 RepID=UPI003A8F37E2
MEQVRSPLAARNIAPGLKSCVIHAHGSWKDAIAKGKHDFFTKLEHKLGRRGVSCYLVDGDGRTAKSLIDEHHLHIIVGGPARFGPTILHAFPTYIWGFWYLDEVGAGWESSLRFARFPRGDVDREEADFFFNGVTSYMQLKNVSKLPQPARARDGLPPASSVIFAQNIEALPNRSHYISTSDMIRCCATTHPDEITYVKAHPLSDKAHRIRLTELCNAYPNVKLVDASVHDLIAAARVTVTQNSSAGFEALMQCKPVITCAKSDYWHATLTPRSTSDLVAALEHGPAAMADFDFGGYLHWFLAQSCLEPAKEEFESRAWARISDKLMLD